MGSFTCEAAASAVEVDCCPSYTISFSRHRHFDQLRERGRSPTQVLAPCGFLSQDRGVPVMQSFHVAYFWHHSLQVICPAGHAAWAGRVVASASPAAMVAMKATLRMCYPPARGQYLESAARLKIPKKGPKTRPPFQRCSWEALLRTSMGTLHNICFATLGDGCVEASSFPSSRLINLALAMGKWISRSLVKMRSTLSAAASMTMISPPPCMRPSNPI
jgi:hypothetical protein